MSGFVSGQTLTAAELNTSFAGKLGAAGDATATTSLSSFTSLTPLARSAKSRNSDIINVCDYGALGDGLRVHSNVTTSGTTINVVGAAFTQADVGKILSIQSLTAGVFNYTSTILTVASGTQVTCSASAATVTAQPCLVTYGTDDNVAISAVFTAVRAYVLATNGGQNLKVRFPNKIFMLSGHGINATQLRYVEIEGDHAFLHGSVTNEAVFDLLGAYGVTVSGAFYVFGDPTTLPTTGYQIGRILVGGAIGRNSLQNLKADGYYSLAPFFSNGSETTFHHNFDMVNFAPNAYAGILDGTYHWNLTSQFVTVTLTHDTYVSFTNNVFIGCRFESDNASSAGLGVSGLEVFNFYGCYVYAQTYNFYAWMGSAMRIRCLRFHGTLENALSACFFVDGPGTDGFTELEDLELNHAEENEPTVPTLDASSAMISINTYGLRLTLDFIPTNLFGSTSINKFNCYGAHIRSDQAFTFTKPTNFTGIVDNATVRTYYGGSYTGGSFVSLQSTNTLTVGVGSTVSGSAFEAIGFNANASGSFSSAKGNQAIADVYGAFVESSGSFTGGQRSDRKRVILRATTTSTTPTVLTASGGATGPTVLANIAASTVALYSIKIVARDTVTGDCAAWVVSDFKASTGTGSTFAFKDTPTVTAIGTGTGTLASVTTPTIVADATNRGPTITATAGGTNLTDWEADIYVIECG